MTGIRDASHPVARWRATIDALEAVVRAASDEPEIDPAEAKEVGRLITMRLAAAGHNNLPAAWVRRPGIDRLSLSAHSCRSARSRGV